MNRYHVFAFLSVLAFLLLVNAFLFPFVFPDGLAEKFANARAEPRPIFHILGFAATAFFLVVITERMIGRSPAPESGRYIRGGLKAGVLLGLLVSLPEHLHLYAMVDATAVRQFIPVGWIIVTWGAAGLIAGTILGRRGRPTARRGSADQPD